MLEAFAARRAVGFALLLLAVPPGATAAPKRVAVLEFAATWSSECGSPAQNPASADRCETLLLLADQSRAGALEVLQPPGYVVMTRENTAQILKDMGVNSGMCSQGECEVETAKLIGADLVISGQVSVLTGTWFASVKLHDVKSAALLGTSLVRGQTTVELVDGVKRDVELMARRVLGGGGGSSLPPAQGVDAGSPRLNQDGPPTLGIVGFFLAPAQATLFKVSDGYGFFVTKVKPGSPAYAAGMLNMDVVIKVGTKEFRSDPDRRQAMARISPGEEVPVTIVRDGRVITLQVRF